MVGELRQRDAQLGAELANRGRPAAPEPVHDPQPNRVGELLEERDTRVVTLTVFGWLNHACTLHDTVNRAMQPTLFQLEYARAVAASHTRRSAASASSLSDADERKASMARKQGRRLAPASRDPMTQPGDALQPSARAQPPTRA